MATRALIDTNILVYRHEELISEDYQHGRMYGIVTVRNPFTSQTAAT